MSITRKLAEQSGKKIELELIRSNSLNQVPLPWSVPAVKETDESLELSSELVETLLADDIGSYYTEHFQETSLLRKCGYLFDMLAPLNIAEGKSIEGQVFNRMDGIVPGFLDIACWGRYMEIDEMPVYVPNPYEFEDLLIDGKFKVGDDMDWVEDLDEWYIGIPSLDCLNYLGQEAIHGNHLLELFKDIPGAGPEEREENFDQTEARVLRFQELHTGEGKMHPHLGLRAVLRERRTSNERFDLYAKARMGRNRECILVEKLKGATETLSKESWYTVLSSLVSAWYQREKELEKLDNPLAKSVLSSIRSGKDCSPSTSGIFVKGFGRLGFSQSDDKVLNFDNQLKRSLQTLSKLFGEKNGTYRGKSPLSSEKLPLTSSEIGSVENWDPRRFVGLIRALDLCLLDTLGSENSRREKVSELLKFADQGHCLSAEEFFDYFPEGKSGFKTYLGEALEAVMVLERSSKEKVKSSLGELTIKYQVPIELAKEVKVFDERSAFMEKASDELAPISKNICGSLDLKVPFVEGLNCCRGRANRWPFLPFEKRPDKEFYMDDVVECLMKMPQKDRMLEWIGQQYLKSKESDVHDDPLSSRALALIANRIKRIQRQERAGLLEEEDRGMADLIISGSPLPLEELKNISPIISDNRCGVDLGELFGNKMVKIFNCEDLERFQAPKRFLTNNPMHFNEKKDIIQLDMIGAKNEVFSWYVWHKDLIQESVIDYRRVKLSEGERVFLNDFINTLEAAAKDLGDLPQLNVKGQNDERSLVKFIEQIHHLESSDQSSMTASAAALNLKLILENAPLIPIDHPEVFGDRKYGEFASFLCEYPSLDSVIEYINKIGLVDRSLSLNESSLDSLEKSLDKRKNQYEVQQFKGKLGRAILKIFPVAMALFKEYPYLTHVDKTISALHPENLIGLNQYLLSGVEIEQLQKPFGQVLESIIALPQDKTDIVEEGVKVSVGVQREVVAIAEEIAHSPLYRGLQVMPGGIGQQIHISGLGGKYYNWIKDKLAGFSGLDGFEYKQENVVGLVNKAKLGLSFDLSKTLSYSERCEVGVVSRSIYFRTEFKNTKEFDEPIVVSSEKDFSADVVDSEPKR